MLQQISDFVLVFLAVELVSPIQFCLSSVVVVIPANHTVNFAHIYGTLEYSGGFLQCTFYMSTMVRPDIFDQTFGSG
jgi:hypothetical protein